MIYFQPFLLLFAELVRFAYELFVDDDVVAFRQFRCLSGQFGDGEHDRDTITIKIINPPKQ